MPPSIRELPSVVVPAIDAPSSTAVLRSLGRRGIHTIAVSERETPPAFDSAYCDETVRVPSPTDDLDAYRDALLSIVERNGVRAVVPMREADAYTLASNREAFAEHVSPVWPTTDQLSAVHDRQQLFAIAEDLDVPMPETSLLREVEDWDRELIVKGRHAMMTADQVESLTTTGTVSPPKTMFLEPGETPDLKAIRDEMYHEPIVQEYVCGTEYSLRGVFDQGEPVATSLKEVVRGIKYSRGPSISQRAVDLPELEAHALALMDHLDWTGPASVGFIRDEVTGEYKLLEVNPRFWSNLPMDVHAGVDFPYYYWGLATGNHEHIDREYDPGTTDHLLRGELVHLHSVLFEDYPLVETPSVSETVRDILASLYQHPRFEYLSVDDPGPFVRDVLNTARGAVSR